MSLRNFRLHQIARVAGLGAMLALGASRVAATARAQGGDEPVGQGDLPPPEPRALQIALDGSYGAGGASNVDLGGGGALRIGPVFPFKWVSLIPELGADVFAFSGTPSAKVFGGFAGARLRIGRGLEPGVFAHGGVSGVRWRDDYAAPTMDVGLSVDLTLIPTLLLGVQGMYKSTFATGQNPSLAWYTAGLTVGVRI
jgi:hypothetical protein